MNTKESNVAHTSIKIIRGVSLKRGTNKKPITALQMVILKSPESERNKSSPRSSLPVPLAPENWEIAWHPPYFYWPALINSRECVFYNRPAPVCATAKNGQKLA